MKQHYGEHRLAGQGAVLLCAVLWSTSGLFIRLIDWHPVVIAGSRSILAAVFLFSVRILSRGFPNGSKKSRFPDVSTVFAKTPGLALCGLCYAATMLLFVTANKLTASANAILLQYTAPVWAALLAWLFRKEKPGRESWCAVVLVSIGMLLVFSNGITAGSAAGDTLALLSGIAFGANSVVLRSRKDGDTAGVMLFAHILCVIFSLPFFGIYPPVFNVNTILSIGFMGIFQVGAASALFAYGIKQIPAVQAMLTAAIEPVLNPAWVLLVTGERPGTGALAGGGIILGAVLFSSILSTLRLRN